MRQTLSNKNFRLKTERAIQIINRYELTHADFMKRDQKVEEESKSIIRIKLLQENLWERIQLLPNCIETYQLAQPKNSLVKQDIGNLEHVSIKIVIKQFTGYNAYLSVSQNSGDFEHFKIQSQKVHLIAAQKLIKIHNLSYNHDKITKRFMSIRSTNGLTMFKIKYQFFKKQTNKKMIENTFSLAQLTTSSQVRSTSLKMDSSRIQGKSLKRKKSPPLSKINQKQILSARSISLQKQKQKIMHAKIKMEALQLYKQKYKQYKQVQHKCKNLLQLLQAMKNQQNQLTSKAIQHTVSVIYLVKFCQAAGIIYKNHQIEKKYSCKNKKLVLKFIHLIKEKYESLLITKDRFVHREQLSIHHFSILAAKCLFKSHRQTALQMVKSCLINTKPQVSINKAFICASVYRRKVRTIQRYFVIRFKAQIEAFLFYISKCLNEFQKKFQHFGALQQDFKSNDVGNKLCLKYLKESSLKLGVIFQNYKNKLQQIDEMKSQNENIKNFNAKALKKHLRPFLIIPKPPDYPVTRFFRDLQILKTMLRTWHQIQYRKWSRKHKNKIQ